RPVQVFEGDGRDGALFSLVIRPDDALVRHHVEILAVERHGVGPAGAEFQSIFSAGTDVHLARHERNAGYRFRNPPAPEQLWFAPRPENRARRRIECPRDDELAIPFALDRRAVLRTT